MIRIGLFAALTAIAGAVYAQAQSGEAVTSPLPERRVESSGELQGAAPARPARNEARAQADADARHCLDLPSNAQVHRCAERYRTHATRSRSATKRASKGSASAKGNVLDIPKAAGASSGTAVTPGTPGAAKTAEPLKSTDASKAGAAAPPQPSAPAAAPAAPAGDATKAAAKSAQAKSAK